MALYAVAIFLSAFFLFQVQPVIAKAILPWFGGSAAVWAACMLFFQTLLLAGYFYSHLLVTRLTRKWQVRIHITLLAASILVLPIAPNARWQPAAGALPVASVLLLLTFSVGLPYFVLSTTGPLLQAWYARTHKAALPYRLFAVSNLACLAGLFSYPFVIEPFVSTRTQLLLCTAGYVAFAVACAAAALATSKAAMVDDRKAHDGKRAGAGQWLLWAMLAAVASALMLSVTNHLCQDVAPVPLLWILPLGVYLLSLILCFGSETWYSPQIVRWALAPTLSVMLLLSAKPVISGSLGALILIFTAGLFVACMFCHGELARLKPEPALLTSFYFAMAAGGATGGIYVGLAAPVLYDVYAELPVSLAACGILAIGLHYGKTSRLPLATACVSICALTVLYVPVPRLLEPGVTRARNFYGAFRIADFPTQAGTVRKIYSGTTLHGLEFLAPQLRDWPTTYYGPASGVGMLLGSGGPPRRVGIVGLGAGTLASYARPLDEFRFYEINPFVVDAARTRFRYLQDCQGRYEVVVGDARLSLADEPAQGFDVLVLDAFSGDAVPVHLLTVEAFQLYFHHMKPNGILAVHITNRFLDLATVVEGACQRLGKHVSIERSPADENRQTDAATWAIVSSGGPAPRFARVKVRPWTDDYSNLLEVISR